MIAKVVVDVAVDKEFDYLVPEPLFEQVKLGSRVNLSFGPRKTQGFVVGFSRESGHPKLKAIESVVGDKPYIAGSLLKLARWIADYYCSPVELAVQSVLPGAVRNQGAKFKEQLFVEESGPRNPGLKTKAPEGEPGLVLGPVSCSQKPERVLTPKQAKTMEVLRANGKMLLSELIKSAETDAGVVKALAKKGLVSITKEASWRDPFANHHYLRTEPPPLMPGQATALEVIKQAIYARSLPSSPLTGEDRGEGGAGAQSPHPNPLPQGERENTSVVLLHGVTGSGKTEVYLQAIDYTLSLGKGAIVLVPEISLTPQTIERFRGRFGDTIAVLHSHLSEGERHDEWHRIHDGRAKIVVGARSAVFAPVEDLGLIVVDEEHEHTYKQEEAPRYHARDVAVMRGHIEKCAVLLGSATPALESFANAKNGKYRLVEMTNRVDHRAMPHMRIVDMRQEAERTGRLSVFSGDLVEAVKKRLARAEQVMLFLNRRGYASSLVCSKCGFVSRCHDCSISMTYHRHDETLKCHVCGAIQGVPDRCPGCQDPAFKFAGLGTQRVELVVAKLFPGARVARMDADATRGKDSHRRILNEFRTGKIDILVGTQMIAKGLDFPNVTLIGVLNADMSLHMPDFRASERTFQLLTQVAGRAGRGEIAGEVIVQTSTPFHQAIQAARRLDYAGFCDQENEFRRELGYPPFGHLVCVGIKGMDPGKVTRAAEDFAGQLQPRLHPQVIMSGPAPAPLEKAKGQYRYQIMLRAPATKTMTQPLKSLAREFRWPAGVSVNIDVDAVSLM